MCRFAAGALRFWAWLIGNRLTCAGEIGEAEPRSNMQLGNLGIAIVQRWLAIVLVGLLSLVWMGSSAFACSQATRHDCCSGADRMPCGEQVSGKVPDTAAMVCCAKAPAPSAVVAAATKRSAHIQAADPQSPDSFVAPFGIESPIRPEGVAPYLFASCAAPACADASLTYLHTLRLRL